MTDSDRLVVGTREIAEIAGVEERTPAKWIARSRRGELDPPFPDPDHPPVSGRKSWLTETPVQWLKDSGRMDAEGFESAKGDVEC